MSWRWRTTFGYALVLMPILALLGLAFANPHGSAPGGVFLVGLVLTWPVLLVYSKIPGESVWFGPAAVSAMYLWCMFIVMLVQAIRAESRRAKK